MADILDQNEIDDLLNESAADENPTEETSEVETEAKPRLKSKTYHYKVNKNVRFPVPYHSPVVKKENVVLNPDSEPERSYNKVVVRTLDNYLDYLKSDA